MKQSIGSDLIKSDSLDESCTNSNQSYSGQLNNKQERHGEGTSYYPNGDMKYKGFWKENMKHGTGKSYHQGTMRPIVEYEGEWVDNVKHGKGKYTSIDGKDKFDGEWGHNQPISGTMMEVLPTGKNNKVFVGHFKDRKLHGKGKLYIGAVSETAMLYNGEWEEGLYHGKDNSPSFINVSSIDFT
jgi:antitoxin component YwqK of YwqJK toxin-antitoxin module